MAKKNIKKIIDQTIFFYFFYLSPIYLSLLIEEAMHVYTVNSFQDTRVCTYSTTTAPSQFYLYSSNQKMNSSEQRLLLFSTWKEFKNNHLSNLKNMSQGINNSNHNLQSKVYFQMHPHASAASHTMPLHFVPLFCLCTYLNNTFFKIRKIFYLTTLSVTHSQKCCIIIWFRSSARQEEE